MAASAGAQLQAAEKRPRFLHRHLADFGDRAARDFHGAGFGAQARAAAIGTGGVSAIAAQKNAHVQLVFFALEPGEKAFHAGKIRAWSPSMMAFALRGGELAERHVERECLSRGRSASDPAASWR